MKYKLIALDMDGTVLNDKKEITPATAQAIHDALSKGVEVVFCTGRSYAGMRLILENFPDMHYLSGESGGLIYDLKEKKVLRQTTFPNEVAMAVRDAAKGENLMPCVFSNGEGYVNKKDVTHMADFYMGQYQGLYQAVATLFDDVLETVTSELLPAEKINLYCSSTELREKMYHMLKERNLPAELVYSEITSLEISPKGLSKAQALRALCEILDITLDEIVMVGDADNDLAALKIAGLPIAMGNANENVSAVAKIKVADNNHDGCAQAIRIALGEETL
ncbi:MAG: Cof-type HAD-IIB family hydrolase [Dorea sp.]|nr:Cof-type HAD-IIB family hydrolase [Dorea sp.]